MDEIVNRGSLVGQRVSNYQIVAKLGAGGMGVVYKAIDIKLDRPVALKFLAVQAGDATHKERLLREARAASALDHVNIGTIYGIEETPEGQLFIVMAYYEGETLFHRIRRGPLPPASAIAIAVQMAHGLAAAHAKGIIHRDIKPSNVLITPQNVVKVVDFGLAKLPGGESLTQTGSTVGTAAYMSPEQALGRELDIRTDVWSLGVVLYQMLTGVLPFRGEQMPSTLYAIVHETPLPMQGAPPDMERVISKFLEKEPTERYQDMEEAARELAALDDSSSLATVTMIRQDSRPASSRRELTASRSRRRSRRAIAGASILVLLVAAAFMVVRARWRSTAPVEKHIAVLPFSNVGNDRANQALCDGLLETLTSRLSELKSSGGSLWVVPAAEVRRRKVTDPATAHRELGATLVVTGSVQRDNNGVRLTVDLVDAANPRQLGSAVLDDQSGDFAALQDRAVARLAGLMDLESSHVPGPAAARAPGAYQAYLRGLGLLQRWDKEGNLANAEREFQDALRTDPQFALAYAALADARWKQYQLSRDSAIIPNATELCNHAIALDPQLAPAYVTLARIHDDTGQHDLAVGEFRHALELQPRSTEAMQGLARVYESMARLQEAEDLLNKAAALQPDYWEGFNRLGSFYVRQRRYKDAVPQFQRVLQLTPDNQAGYINLAVCYSDLGRWREAQELLERALKIAPNYAAYSNLGRIYLNQDNFLQAAESFEKALRLNDKDYRLWGNLALAYDYAGNKTKAQAGFEQAVKLAEAAAKLNPNDAGVQASLGWYLAILGRRDDALLRMRAALARAGDDPQVLKRVAEIYERLGMRREAVEATRRALDRGYGWYDVKLNRELQPLLNDPLLKQK
jgi:serine/threonine-protein kinase